MATERLFEQLLSRDPLPPLLPRTPFSDATAQQIKGLAAAGLNSNVVAVLDLLNDDITACHLNVQQREGDKTADLMHAILHRREGDFWNSKWWLSQIQHPIIEAVHGGTKGAKDFVDEVERARLAGDKEAISKCEQKQKEELQALAQHVQKTLLKKSS